MPIPLISVVGATASKKTDLAIQLAKQLNGEIISADSMQIYKYMDIGTATPSASELEATRFHLVSCLTPDIAYNTGQFVLDASQAILDIIARGKLPILAGGSHLYIQSLCFGLRALPTIEQPILDKVAKLHQGQGLEACYAILQENLPDVAANLHPNDISRIHRALAVFWQTGKSLASFQTVLNPIEVKPFFIAVHWERAQLFKRINKRVELMLKQGLLEETENLLQNYSPSLPSMNSIGYKQAVAFLNQTMDKASMLQDIQKKSRVYAKKQLIWLRKQQVHYVTGQDKAFNEREIKQLLQQMHTFLASSK